MSVDDSCVYRLGTLGHVFFILFSKFPILMPDYILVISEVVVEFGAPRFLGVLPDLKFWEPSWLPDFFA